MANPTVRASSTNSVATGPPTCAKPAGTLDGDVLVATVTDPNGSASNPGGWTQVYGAAIVGTRYLSIWTKVASGEPASWTWPGSGSGFVVNVVAIQDCISATPLATTYQNGSSASLVAPSITPGVANSLLIGAFMVEASVTDITPPGTMTEDQDTARGANYRVEVSHESYAPATASGTRTATATAAGAYTAWLGAFQGTSLSGVGGTPAYKAELHVFGGSASPLATIPATVAGDLMYVFLFISGSGPPTITSVPAGWSQLDQTTNSNMRLAVYWKFAGASEPGSYTWGISASSNYMTQTCIISTPGDTLLPNDGHAILANTAGATHPAPSVTTTRANGLLVNATFIAPIDATGTLTVDALVTQRAMYAGGATFGIVGALATQSIAAIGGTGTRTAVYDKGSSIDICWNGVVLGPPGGGPAPQRAEPFLWSL